MREVENVSTLVPLGNTLVIAHETGFVFLEDGKQRQQRLAAIRANGVAVPLTGVPENCQQTPQVPSSNPAE